MGFRDHRIRRNRWAAARNSLKLLVAGLFLPWRREWASGLCHNRSRPKLAFPYMALDLGELCSPGHEMWGWVFDGHAEPEFDGVSVNEGARKTRGGKSTLAGMTTHARKPTRRPPTPHPKKQNPHTGFVAAPSGVRVCSESTIHLLPLEAVNEASNPSPF